MQRFRTGNERLRQAVADGARPQEIQSLVRDLNTAYQAVNGNFHAKIWMKRMIKLDSGLGRLYGRFDAANKTLHVLRALATVKADCLIWVLLGEGYAHSYNTLVETVSRDSRHEIVLAKTNRTMWHVMSQCAVAVLAGGLTTIEAVYAGLPSINLSEKPEHSALMQELFALGVCMDGGPFERPALDAMVKEVTLLSSNRNKLWEIRNQTKGLLDLNGPSRVMEEIRREFAARKTTT